MGEYTYKASEKKKKSHAVSEKSKEIVSKSFFQTKMYIFNTLEEISN